MTIPCPSDCCWGNDVGELTANGYVCSHCGESYALTEFLVVLAEHRRSHLTEAERLSELMATVQRLLESA